MSVQKTKTIAFVGKYPLRTKTVSHNKSNTCLLYTSHFARVNGNLGVRRPICNLNSTYIDKLLAQRIMETIFCSKNC